MSLRTIASTALLVALTASAAQADPDTRWERKLERMLERAGARPLKRPRADSAELIELGRNLFFDKVLSGNKNISCATCHHPVSHSSDNLPLPIGEGGKGLAQVRTLAQGSIIPRNSPDVFNDGLEGTNVMFWDGRVRHDGVNGLTTPEPGLNGPAPRLGAIAGQLDSALAAQAMFPPTSADEMRGHPGTNEIADATSNEEVWRLLMLRLLGEGAFDAPQGGIDAYRRMFRAAYPRVPTLDGFNFGHAARAIAAFERSSWTAIDSPFDRYLRGDRRALSEQAKHGAALFFGQAGCASCHSGPQLSDFDFHALGVPQLGPGKDAQGDDRGLGNETQNPADDYKFRTPALRNVAITGPWMHDGAYMNLQDAVEHHLNPQRSMRRYLAGKTQQPPSRFASSIDRDPARNAARLRAVDPRLRLRRRLGKRGMADLIAFLNALTDPSSLNELNDVPESVPSGLPIWD